MAQLLSTEHILVFKSIFIENFATSSKSRRNQMPDAYNTLFMIFQITKSFKGSEMSSNDISCITSRSDIIGHHNIFQSNFFPSFLLLLHL